MFPAVGGKEDVDVRPQLVGAQETVPRIVGIEEPKEDADCIGRELVDFVNAQGDMSFPDDVFQREMLGLREVATLSLVVRHEVASDRVRALPRAIDNGVAALTIRPLVVGDLPVTCASGEGLVNHLTRSRLADSNAPIKEQESRGRIRSARSARESGVSYRTVERGFSSGHGISWY